MVFQNGEDVRVLLCQNPEQLLTRQALNQVASLPFVEFPLILSFLVTFVYFGYYDFFALGGHHLLELFSFQEINWLKLSVTFGGCRIDGHLHFISARIAEIWH